MKWVMKMVKKKKSKSKKIDLLRISNFVLLNTLIFHEILANNYPTKIRSLKRINKNQQAILIDEWKKIIDEINYIPIFSLAIRILSSYPVSPQIENLIKELKNLALDLLSSGVLMKHDLMGRIYHKLLLKTTGGYYATYYTSIPAAILLGDLIVKTEHNKWFFGDKEFLENFRLIDPACGSGTLLSACYLAIKDRYITEADNADLKFLHKVLMEKVIWGFDVLDYATHLSLITLALHNPKGIFTSAHIYTLKNGYENGKIYLGSLYLLNPQSNLLSIKDWAITVAKKKSDEDEREKDILISSLYKNFDIVIMNPPFSRSAKPNITFGYAEKKVQKLMKKELRKIIRDIGYQDIGKAGLGAPFIVLGHKLLKEEGRIGVVIPRAILSGVSWSKIRDLIWNEYEIEYIISNFDPGDKQENVEGWNWSENTDLGEVLIIARKTQKPSNKKETIFVNVWQKPKNSVESLLLSQIIRKKRKNLADSLLNNYWEDIVQGGKTKATMYKIPQTMLRDNWHIPCVFAQPSLNKFIMDVLQGIQMSPLDRFLSNIGPDIKVIKTHFEKANYTTQYPIVWGHQSIMNTIQLSQTFIGYGKPKSSRCDEIYNDNKSTLLLASRPHINIENLLAVETPNPVLATAFWELRLKKPEYKSLILLWLNSTFGFVLTLAYSVNSKAQIFKLKKEQLKYIPIPIPNSINLSEALKLYNKIKNKAFHSYPEEFDLASQGSGVRKMIDDFFISELNLNFNMQPIYKMLSQEPSLTLRRL